ncbi:MAG: GGDEF domain-containing protein [Lachnospiraceae bacterium]|nr:GGDEF domain-containing protein [Lachnospiraceae bacterium]
MKEKRKPTRKTILRTLFTVYAVISICLTTAMIDRMFSSDYSSISQCVTLNDGWNITINDRAYHNVSLDTFRFDSVNKGDTITMIRSFPGRLDCVGNALLLPVRQTAVKIYVDANQIYQYGWDRLNQHKTVGSGHLTVELPDNYAEKTLKLHLTVGEDSAFTRFDPIRIYEWKNVYRVILTENRLPLFLGCFLTIFGLVTCFITIFALQFSGRFLRILCVSLFSICIGLWTLCYYNALLIFSMPLYTIGLLEYLALYLAPIPLVIYMREDVRALNRPLMYHFYRALLTVQIAATTILIGLHTVDLVHCAATLKYMQALIVCNLVYFVIVEFMNLHISHQLVHKLFLVGMLLLSACVFYDLLFYYMDRYRGVTLLPVKGVAPLGLVIFIFILLVSFYINLTEKMMQETERNSLIRSAYTDELTKIHNRRYCMEYMNRIMKMENPDYTVFCFDLNNLKVTNDTYGHAKGDLLIKSAAEVIDKAFSPYGIVARMGGDEFIAIAETGDPEKISSITGEFQECIREKNLEIPDLHLSIAYGYASCSPKEYNIEKIYQIADDRMYENKQAQKRSGALTPDRENASHSPTAVSPAVQ